jgi:uroporphyrin-III C-methyltransferase
MIDPISPRLSLVGAGPGDIELISVKGLNAIKSADVILYDALVNPDFLRYSKTTAIKIYVGKRNHEHTFSQDEVNNLIVHHALHHGHVVRLKGGDPFVFGRGKEEILFVEAFGIETQVIPGISSSIAVPALAGIPVTHRGASESFWVITGTTKHNKLSKDVYVAAKTDATVIILMGLSKLREITEVFINEGKNNIAIAIIQNGSLPNQKIALGNMNTILENSEKENIQAPAVIVIGEVVKQHKSFPVELLQSILVA